MVTPGVKWAQHLIAEITRIWLIIFSRTAACFLSGALQHSELAEILRFLTQQLHWTASFATSARENPANHASVSTRCGELRIFGKSKRTTPKICAESTTGLWRPRLAPKPEPHSNQPGRLGQEQASGSWSPRPKTPRDRHRGASRPPGG